MRKIWMILLALVAVLSLALVACGGDDDDDDDDGNGGTSPTATQASGGNGDDDDDDDDPLSDFRRRAQALEGKTFSATFQTRYESSVDGLQEGTMRFAIDPEGERFAIIMDATGDDGPLRGAIIQTPDVSYLCFDEPPDEPGCIDLALLGGAGGAFAGVFNAFNVQTLITEAAASAGRVERVGDRTINGRSAECYEFEDEEASGVACFDKDSGIILFLEGEDSEGTFRLETSEYIEAVSDSDFEPPYPLVDPNDF